MIQLDTTVPSNAPAIENEACGTEEDSDVAVVEGALNEKGSPAPTALLSWEEMIEMLKRVSCFTNDEAPFTKMSDFFPLTKRISVNMGGDPLPSCQPDSLSTSLSLSCLVSSIYRNGQC